MPGMDGRQVCKAIRQFSEIPILVLSALSKPETVARVLDEGADDYLIKPVSSDTLIAHLNSLIRRTQGRRIADRVANVG
jgi:DNA-binding response OmpR family regulator